jgi:hypothetical protein
MRHSNAPVLCILFACSLAACSADSGSSTAGDLEIVRDTVGDTLVVRIVSGSSWGSDAHLVPEVSIGELEGDLEYLLGDVVSLGVTSDGTIHLVDGQIPELRSYSADGTYLATVAGPGEGPGELNTPHGGLAVLSDDRIVVRDPGNTRLQVFQDGQAIEAWPVVRGGFQSSAPLWWDWDDNVYVFVIRNMGDDFGDWDLGFARITSDGTPADTLSDPETGFEAPRVEARNENSVSMNGVPFAAAEQTGFHPAGYFVRGISTEYAFTLLKKSQPLRIERSVERVPVAPGEESTRRRAIERNMRRLDPGWSWNGVDIPDFKAHFTDFLMGRKGRIWVQVAQPAVEEDNPDYDPREEGSEPRRWREPVAFDVFGEDGTFFGRVHTPEGFSTNPTPVIDGDYIWAVTRDDLGVQRVVRFKVTLDGPAAQR